MPDSRRKFDPEFREGGLLFCRGVGGRARFAEDVEAQVAA
jgi:hypothetical protein